MKRFLSMVLAVIICVSCVPLAATAKRDLTKEEILAGELRDLGLFKGVSETDFALGRAPSRVEAVVMLIRVLGKEKEVTADKWRHPFTDVPAWADNYIGYAYSKGLTNGTSASTFGSGDASAAMYMTFMLRALGYSDTNGEDFTWSDPFTLAQETGIYPDSVNIKKFWRADVVLISHAALSAYVKGANATLARKLISDGVFTSDDFEKYYNVHDVDSIEVATGEELTPEEIYEICSPAVFYIEVYDEKGNAFASGSGFFIDDNGTAVTNFHVIDEALSAIAFMSETGKQFKILGVYDYSVENDWAVIKVDCTGNSYLERDDGSTVVGAASVYAIGSPRGLQNTISTGIISNPERELDGVKYIQTTAPISHGSSGGALLNKYGEVIGITSASNTSGQSLNFALPISCIDGYKSGEITPLDVLNKPNIQYILSAQSVNVNVGEAQYITLDLVTKGVHGETYSVSSEDSSIAQVGWTAVDSEELPWSITIVGLSPGTTFLNITNDYNGQYARVQINVIGAATSTPQGTISYLKTWLMKNGKYSDGVYTKYNLANSNNGKYFQRICYDVSKDELYTDLLSNATPPSDFQTYSEIVFNTDGTCTFVCAFYSHSSDKDPSTFGMATVNPQSYRFNNSVYLTYYEGFDNLKEQFSEICGIDLSMMLLNLDDFLQYSIGGISIADLGFTNFN